MKDEKGYQLPPPDRRAEFKMASLNATRKTALKDPIFHPRQQGKTHAILIEELKLHIEMRDERNRKLEKKNKELVKEITEMRANFEGEMAEAEIITMGELMKYLDKKGAFVSSGYPPKLFDEFLSERYGGYVE